MSSSLRFISICLNLVFIKPNTSTFHFFKATLTPLSFSFKTKAPQPCTIRSFQTSFTTSWKLLTWNQKLSTLKGLGPWSKRLIRITKGQWLEMLLFNTCWVHPCQEFNHSLDNNTINYTFCTPIRLVSSEAPTNEGYITKLHLFYELNFSISLPLWEPYLSLTHYLPCCILLKSPKTHHLDTFELALQVFKSFQSLLFSIIHKNKFHIFILPSPFQTKKAEKAMSHKHIIQGENFFIPKT